MPPDLRVRMNERPGSFKAKKKFLVDSSLVLSRDEKAIVLAFMGHSRLFGDCYRRLQPDYFAQMPPKSGIVICPTVQTRELIPAAARPGDIDLLVVPYENDELVVSRTLVLEVKIVRASFLRQSKSPNDFGYSQTKALLELGFPYVGLVHLIISDSSPKASWRQVFVTQILDDQGNVGKLSPVLKDLMPADLIGRTFGRLVSNQLQKEVGLVAAYIDRWIRRGQNLHIRRGFWQPMCQKAGENPLFDAKAVNNVATYYEQNSSYFHRIRRHDDH